MKKKARKDSLETTVSLFDESGKLKPFAVLKNEIIDIAVAHSPNITKAAAALEIGTSTIYRRYEG